MILYIILFILSILTTFSILGLYNLWNNQKTITEAYNELIDDINNLYKVNQLLQSQIDDDGWIYMDFDLDE